MAVQTYFDGVEVTDIVLSGSVTRKLNGPSQATCRMPCFLAQGGIGSRYKVVIDGTLWFHGFVLQTSDEGDEDVCYTEFTAIDPWELWQWRPARDGEASGDAGDFSNPDFFYRVKYGPQIMEEILTQSQNWTDYLDDDDAEGPLFIEFDSSSFATGGIDLSGAPTDWPMTIDEIANLLTSTGEVDIILTPIDSGGNMARLDVFNGDYGNDLRGSVVFDYAMGNYNVRQMRQVVDGTTMCNKLWYYGGPRVKTADDPGGIQHWCWNITGSDTFLSLDPFDPIFFADLIEARDIARGIYGARMEIKIWDARGEDCSDSITSAERQLYRKLWLQESFIRNGPRQLVHFTPVRGTDINFDIGDIVTVRSGPLIRGGFSGAQRVYGFTVNWDADGVTELGEIMTSADQG